MGFQFINFILGQSQTTLTPIGSLPAQQGPQPRPLQPPATQMPSLLPLNPQGSTLTYTQTMQPPDLRAQHPGYCKFIKLCYSLLRCVIS